jgi:Mg2+ and Co2+ transporter CorA
VDDRSNSNLPPPEPSIDTMASSPNNSTTAGGSARVMSPVSDVEMAAVGRPGGGGRQSDYAASPRGVPPVRTPAEDFTGPMPNADAMFDHGQNGQAILHFDDDDDEQALLQRGPGTSPSTSHAPEAGDVSSGVSGGAAGEGAAAEESRRHRRAHLGEAVTRRMRRVAFAQLTHRSGERFTVLQQEGTTAPILRDFPTLEGLIDHLKTLEGKFSGLTAKESDWDEPDAHRLERALNRQFSGYRTRSYSSSSDKSSSSSEKNNKRKSKQQKPQKPQMPRPDDGNLHASFDFAGAATAKSQRSSSSSSSSTSTMSGLAPERTLWIDIQCERHEVIEDVLGLFPRLERDTIDDLLQHDAIDTAHWFHAHRYLFANIECMQAGSMSNQSMVVPLQRGGLEPSTSRTVVSLVAFSDVCVTVHQQPYAGHRLTLQTLHGLTSRRKRSHASPGAPLNAATPGVGKRPVSRRTRLTIGTIVATLIESVVTATLPDPTACLAEVDRIDEMVLLVTKDSRDLLRRIARVRRVLSAHRSHLFRKERFLQQFTSPALKATFISGLNAEQYRHVLGEVFHIAERLEAARDVLTQANSNFVSHISLQMSKVSNQMNLKMKTLAQVTTVCLPLNIITGMMGMNVQVPYSAQMHPDTLVPFGIIIVIMAAIVMLGIPFTMAGMREKDLNRDDDNLDE